MRTNLNNFWCHPEWSSYHCVPFCHRVLIHKLWWQWRQTTSHPAHSQLSGHSKIGQFCLSLSVEKDIASFDVPGNKQENRDSVGNKEWERIYRWIFLLKWRYSRPLRVILRTTAISCSDNCEKFNERSLEQTRKWQKRRQIRTDVVRKSKLQSFSMLKGSAHHWRIYVHSV